MVSNCPRCQIVHDIKLSGVSNCPRYQIVCGVKLSAVSNCRRFQIVPQPLSKHLFAQNISQTLFPNWLVAGPCRCKDGGHDMSGVELAAAYTSHACLLAIYMGYLAPEWIYRKIFGGYLAGIDERQNSPIERRKGNFKTISPISRGEREIRISCPQFERRKRNHKKIFSTFEKRKRRVYHLLKLREENEKSNNYTSFYERRKRNSKCFSPISRGEREYWNSFPQFGE